MQELISRPTGKSIELIHTLCCRIPQDHSQQFFRTGIHSTAFVCDPTVRGACVMRRLTSIVAMAQHGAIGAGNRLPWRVKSDLLFFRTTTSGNVIIMGRRTRDSLGGCLPNRDNVIVTRGFDLFPQTPTCRPSGGIPEALALAETIARSRKEVFVIGGATMYDQFSPYVDRYLVTYIDKVVPDADTFFRPAWLEDADRWNKKILQIGEANGSGDETSFRVVEYIARNKDQIAKLRQQAIENFRAPSRRRLEHSTPSGISLVA